MDSEQRELAVHPLASDRSLNGYVALVTGASRGIGRAAALALASRGANVAVLARSREAVEATASDIRSIGRHALALEADVADSNAAARSARAAVEQLGPVDVLVNSAGMLGGYGRVWELESEDFLRALTINVLGPFHFMKALLPNMVQRRRGVVINLSSSLARKPRPGRTIYGTSKAAIDHLTEAAAAEVAPYDVRVHVVYPGSVDTAMNLAFRTAPGLPAEEREQLAAQARSGGLLKPEEPAKVIAWLASPAGAQWNEVSLRWVDPQVRERVRKLAGFE